MESKENKVGFFNRVGIAIFKLEDYGMFLGERCSVAFKYLLLLILLISVCVSLASAYDFSKMMNKAYSYVENELPDFNYSDNKLSFSDKIEAYDNDYKFRLFIDTSDTVSDETLKDYENKIYDDENGMILLNDKLLYIFGGEKIEDTYENLFNQYGLNISNKQDFVNSIQTIKGTSLVTTYFGTSLVAQFISTVIQTIADLCLIALFGYIASMFCGVKFKVSPMIALSIYSITLSLVLSGIYGVVYILTGFVIKYFNVMYLLIAYIYIIAAIFMIKYDLIKQSEELQKIIEVQKQVRKEMDEKKEEDNSTEDKKEKDKKEEKPEDETPEIDENKEPDGSEI